MSTPYNESVADIRLFVWNAQGAQGAKCDDKWDYLWSTYLKKRVDEGCEVLGLIVESGRAPWYGNDEAAMKVIKRNSESTYEKQGYDGESRKFGDKDRYFASYWIPWVKNTEALLSNPRCSAGALVYSKYLAVTANRVTLQDSVNALLRPAIVFRLKRNNNVILNVYLVHLLSGYEPKAKVERNALARAVAKLDAQSTPAIIVGDFNIDLLKSEESKTLPDGWQLLNCGEKTQKSGGELDFAIYKNIKTAPVCALREVPDITSDHGIMEYQLKL